MEFLLAVARQGPRVRGKAAKAAEEALNLDWLVILVYLAVAGLCFWAAWKESHGRSSGRRVPRFWVVVGSLLAFLGISKLVGLQGWLYELGRGVSKSEGWYAERRAVQGLLIVQALILGAAALTLAWWFVRRLWRQYLLAIGSLVYLVTYIIVRAISLHQVDAWLVAPCCLGFSLGAGLELLGLAGLAAAVILALRDERRPPPMEAYEKRVWIR